VRNLEIMLSKKKREENNEMNTKNNMDSHNGSQILAKTLTSAY